MEESLLTVDEAASQLRVSPDTIRRMLRDGKLYGQKVNGQWRIPSRVLAAIAAPLGELFNEQVEILQDRELGDFKVAQSTRLYVISETRGTGGSYNHTITVSETSLLSPDHLKRVRFDLPLNEQNITWKFVSNDGSSQSLVVPRSLVRDMKESLNKAYSLTTDDEARAAIEDAYFHVQTALGKNDEARSDVIWQARDERNRALFGLNLA